MLNFISQGCNWTSHIINSDKKMETRHQCGILCCKITGKKVQLCISELLVAQLLEAFLFKLEMQDRLHTVGFTFLLLKHLCSSCFKSTRGHATRSRRSHQTPWNYRRRLVKVTVSSLTVKLRFHSRWTEQTDVVEVKQCFARSLRRHQIY